MLDLLAIVEVVIIVELHELWRRAVWKRRGGLKVWWGVEEGCWWVRSGQIAGKAGEVDAIVDTWAAGAQLRWVVQGVVGAECHAILGLLRVRNAAGGWDKKCGCAESGGSLGRVVVVRKVALS
jgi:hypothetical protein